MTPRPSLDRRGFLARLAGGAAALAAVSALGGCGDAPAGLTTSNALAGAELFLLGTGAGSLDPTTYDQAAGSIGTPT